MCDVYDEEYAGGPGRVGRRHRLRAVPGEPPLPDSRGRALERRPPGRQKRRPRHPGACAPSRPPTRDLLDGIFGDAPWTNKERLPDETLTRPDRALLQPTLSVANVPEDELGDAYEYLIKKFADDSGHTAAEFYTNRTVVHLMTQMLAPQPGESVYDPTCGTGGMLLYCARRTAAPGKECRTLRLYGQERNLITSAIARMNLFLHGVEEFEIVRGDTLAEPEAHRGRPPAAVRRDAGQPAVLHQAVGPGGMVSPTRGAATSSARRRKAAPTTPSSSTSSPASTPRGALCHPLPARRAVP